MRQVVKISNSLSKEQKKELSDKLEALMVKFGKFGHSDYSTGILDGLNIAHKLINEVNDDYNCKD